MCVSPGLVLPITSALGSQPFLPQDPGKDKELEMVLLSTLLPNNWSWEETRPLN